MPPGNLRFNTDDFNNRVPPPILYWYSPIGAWFSAFFDQPYLRFSDPRTFNDPFEFRPTVTFRGPIDGIRALRQHQGLVDISAQDARIRLANNLHGFATRYYRVRCFTEDPLSPLMWAHYAASHCGVVFGVDSDLVAPTRRGNAYAGPVQYLVNRPTVRLPPIDRLHHRSDTVRVIFSKPAEWSYEREWRMALVSNPEEAPPAAFRDLNIPESLLRIVIVGARASVADFRDVRRWVDANPDLRRNVEVVRAEVVDDVFGFRLYRPNGARFDLLRFTSRFEQQRAERRRRGYRWYAPAVNNDPAKFDAVEKPQVVLPEPD